jgi:DNA polymerase-3 subunit delta'
MIYSWQNEQWRSIVSLKKRDCLPHALLFHGSAGVGKTSFARHLSRSVLCLDPGEDGIACGHCHSCQLVDAETHPDLVLVKPVPPEKSKSKKPVLNIRVDTVRHLCSRLSSTSQMGGYRVAIIEDAERMVMHASNALLKTLEEPGRDTLILLVSSHPHQLPVTVRSRCQSVCFPEPDKTVALDWLESQGIQETRRWLKYAHGAPLLAMQYAQEQSTERQLLAEALLASSKGKSSLSYAQKLADLPREYTLLWLLDWIGDVIRLKHGDEDIPLINEEFREKLRIRAEKSDTRRMFDYYDQICSYIRQDGIALNAQLLWENLLISWDNL